MNESVLNKGNHKNRQDVVHRIYSEDLPLHCPPDNTELWSQHPRVFLPIAPVKPPFALTVEISSFCPRVTLSAITQAHCGHPFKNSRHRPRLGRRYGDGAKLVQLS